MGWLSRKKVEMQILESNDAGTSVDTSLTGIDTSICISDQCSLRLASRMAANSKNPSLSADYFDGVNPAVVGDSILHHKADRDFLSFIPGNLLEITTEAAKQGFLVSFLLTLNDEFLTNCFKACRLSDEKIYWITQVIRALALIAFGSSLEIAILTPLANYLLTRFKILSKDNANYLTTGVVLSIDLLTSELSVTETSIIVVASVVAARLGADLAREGYRKLRRLFRSRWSIQARNSL